MADCDGLPGLRAFSAANLSVYEFQSQSHRFLSSNVPHVTQDLYLADIEVDGSKFYMLPLPYAEVDADQCPLSLMHHMHA